jgi:hypothetical protein
MRREVLAAALFLLAGRLAAWGGTPLNWLGGTQPWDSTPFEEVDLQALGNGGDGEGQAGLGAQWGVLDELQASGNWLRSLPGGASSGEADLRLREPYFPDWRPAFSVYARAPYADGLWSAWGGLAADISACESDVAMNAEMGDGGRWRVRLAFWTPYLLTTLRLGAEASWLDASAEAFTPQVLVNVPGDISLQAGARLEPQSAAPLWTLRLSYELFPNP